MRAFGQPCLVLLLCYVLFFFFFNSSLEPSWVVSKVKSFEEWGFFASNNLELNKISQEETVQPN